MRDSVRKGDFEHSNEESNENSSNEEENQSPMSGRKGDAENINDKEKTTLIKRNTLEYVSVGQKVRLINTMRKGGDGHTHQKIQNVLLITIKRKRRIVYKIQKERKTSRPWMG